MDTLSAGASGGVVERDANQLALHLTPTVADMRFSPPSGIPALAGCGSRFITISGNDLVLANAQDFLRGKGSSGRTVGQWEGDAMRNFTGNIHIGSENGWADGVYTHVASPSGYCGGNWQGTRQYKFDPSIQVPTSTENRPKSLTALLCIYHGVV